MKNICFGLPQKELNFMRFTLHISMTWKWLSWHEFQRLLSRAFLSVAPTEFFLQNQHLTVSHSMRKPFSDNFTDFSCLCFFSFSFWDKENDLSIDLATLTCFSSCELAISEWCNDKIYEFESTNRNITSAAWDDETHFLFGQRQANSTA